uniref:IS1 family transposase n=1 Tax=Xenorhabdus sp. BG5 TaxID=2782014 RepID=UPI00210769E4|nr:IS1 family transposase [Xenorhabdus sp. BG5]
MPTLVMVCLGTSSKMHHCPYVWNEKQKTLKKRLKKRASFDVVFWCTDNFKAYNLSPKSQHLVGKTFTQRIEREDLTLRNRLKRLNRKPLGYSKSPEMHDKVIGTFIEREYSI